MNDRLHWLITSFARDYSHSAKFEIAFYEDGGFDSTELGRATEYYNRILRAFERAVEAIEYKERMLRFATSIEDGIKISHVNAFVAGLKGARVIRDSEDYAHYETTADRMTAFYRIEGVEFRVDVKPTDLVGHSLVFQRASRHDHEIRTTYTVAE